MFSPHVSIDYLVPATLNDPFNPEDWLNDAQWKVLNPILFQVLNTQGPSKRQDDRAFLTALAYLIKTNSCWRDLPAELGDWHAVYVRFRRWEKARVFACIYNELDDRSMETIKELFCNDPLFEPKHLQSNYLSIRNRLCAAAHMEVW